MPLFEIAFQGQVRSGVTQEQARARIGSACVDNDWIDGEVVFAGIGGARKRDRQAGAEPKGSRVEPRDAYMAAFSEVEAPDFDIAPVGSDMQHEYETFTPLPIDLSALSLAPPGADLDELKRSEGAPVPNTDHLKLED